MEEVSDEYAKLYANSEQQKEAEGARDKLQSDKDIVDKAR